MATTQTIKKIVRAGAWYAVAQLLTKEGQARQTVRKLLVGILLIAAAIAIGFAGLQLLLIGILLWVTENHEYVRPAITIGSSIVLIAALLGWQGWKRFIKKETTNPPHKIW